MRYSGHGDIDRAGVRAVLDRIVQQVDQHLLQTQGINLGLKCWRGTDGDRVGRTPRS